MPNKKTLKPNSTQNTNGKLKTYQRSTSLMGMFSCFPKGYQHPTSHVAPVVFKDDPADKAYAVHVCHIRGNSNL